MLHPDVLSELLNLEVFGSPKPIDGACVIWGVGFVVEGEREADLMRAASLEVFVSPNLLDPMARASYWEHGVVGFVVVRGERQT